MMKIRVAVTAFAPDDKVDELAEKIQASLEKQIKVEHVRIDRVNVREVADG